MAVEPCDYSLVLEHVRNCKAYASTASVLFKRPRRKFEENVSMAQLEAIAMAVNKPIRDGEKRNGVTITRECEFLGVVFQAPTGAY